MHFHNAVLAVLAGVAPLVARADDLELDRDDIPASCSSICEPTRRLADICDVDDDRINNDRIEDLLNLQCVCTNKSFDVARFAALCQSCMSQNTNDRSDLEDINEIVSKCGFASQSYAASQSNAAASITVSAIRPTDSAQLTTTLAVGGGSGSTSTPTGSAATTRTTTNTAATGAATSSPAGSMAAAAVPRGGIVALGAAAVAVLGTMLLI